MPKQTVYIRNADLEAWRALPNKSLWIHDHLGDSAVPAERKPHVPRVFQEPPTEWVTPSLVPRLEQLVKEKNLKFCKNDHPIPEGHSKCLGKGCKYS
jgi:hypothetical protein